MATPNSYSEYQLSNYMFAVTANVASAVGWEAYDFTEAVNDALSIYGVSSIGLATDIPKLRAIAKVEAWRAVADATAADYKFSADGGSYDRQQMHEHAVKAFERAEADSIAKGYSSSTVVIGIGAMKHRDPYLTNETLYH